jgi:predicted RNase H-like HicB family nuclease
VPLDQQPARRDTLSFHIEFEQEADGRWIAEIGELPGAMCYGETRKEAETKVTALALRLVADRIEEEGVAKKSIHFVVST